MALVLHILYDYNAADIGFFLDRVTEFCDEEISVEDVVKRAIREGDVDITGLAGHYISNALSASNSFSNFSL